MDAGFSIREALEFGWDAFKRHAGAAVVIGVASLLTMLVVDALVRMAADQAGPAALLAVFAQLLQLFWSLVWIRFALAVHDLRPAPPRELLPDGKTFIEYVAASLLYSLLVAIGLVLLVIPGLYLAARYGLVSFVIAERRAGPIDAFHQSASLTRGARWKLLLLMLLLGVLNLVGALLLGFGLLATVPLSALAMAFVYRRLIARAEQPALAAPPWRPAPPLPV